MTSASDRAAELREQAAAYDRLGRLESKAAEAKAAYQADPTDEKLKAKHRAAGKALADAREESRAAAAGATVDDGAATVVPEGISASGKAHG